MTDTKSNTQFLLFYLYYFISVIFRGNYADPTSVYVSFVIVATEGAHGEA